MSLVSGVVSVSQDLTTALDARRLTWPNGAIATTYSADEPERLRDRNTTQRGVMK